MVSVTVEQIGIYTIADLERERELYDSLRWELLDGELVMTPSPQHRSWPSRSSPPRCESGSWWAGHTDWSSTPRETRRSPWANRWN